MSTRWFLSGIAFLVSLTLATGAVAQQPSATRAASTPGASVDQLSQQAYQLAQSAKSLDELTESLRVCSQAMKATPTAEQKQYIQKLAGWIYNKRGEVLVKLAEQTANSDQQRSAGYEKAAAKDFDLSVQFDKTRWKSRFNRAVSVAMTGDYRKALQDLDFVVEKQPKHKNALFNRAEILLQLGEYQRAQSDYTQVIQLDPRDAAAHAGRGIALAAIGQSDNAMADLNKVVQLEPENATAYVDRADLYAALADWKRAASDYRMAIKLDSQSARAYQNVAWLMATCPDENFRDPSLAVKAAKRAIDLQGPTYLGLDTYAAALASVGQFAKAVSAQQQAVQASPAEERAELEQRLGLYRQQRMYVERTSDSNVRLASAEEELLQ